MTPKSKATAEVLELRKDAYRQRMTTSHWPHFFNAARDDDAAEAQPQDPLDPEASEAACRRPLIA